jgi:hypothetical protein
MVEAILREEKVCTFFFFLNFFLRYIVAFHLFLGGKKGFGGSGGDGGPGGNGTHQSIHVHVPSCSFKVGLADRMVEPLA